MDWMNDQSPAVRRFWAEYEFKMRQSGFSANLSQTGQIGHSHRLRELVERIGDSARAIAEVTLSVIE